MTEPRPSQDFRDRVIEDLATLTAGQKHTTEILTVIQTHLESYNSRVVAVEQNLELHKSNCPLISRVVDLELLVKYFRPFKRVAWILVVVVGALAIVHWPEVWAIIK